jgi:2-dehydro-3-deoxyphosphogluconate aldolase/(4S)-4-hydroxy-2-oxoglutarate aldolase
MTERSLARLLGRKTVIPVVVVDHAEDGESRAAALLAGGLNAIEITLRTPAAAEAAR